MRRWGGRNRRRCAVSGDQGADVCQPAQTEEQRLPAVLGSSDGREAADGARGEGGATWTWEHLPRRSAPRHRGAAQAVEAKVKVEVEVEATTDGRQKTDPETTARLNASG